VAEVTEVVPDEVDATLSLSRLVWVQMVLNETTLEEAIASEEATVEGSAETLSAVFNSFT
jgi:alkyl sulfatase BDS1-like metallo-beta-lactamase superfamily hydrolase